MTAAYTRWQEGARCATASWSTTYTQAEYGSRAMDAAEAGTASESTMSSYVHLSSCTTIMVDCCAASYATTDRFAVRSTAFCGAPY